MTHIDRRTKFITLINVSQMYFISLHIIQDMILRFTGFYFYLTPTAARSKQRKRDG